jgi:pantetheine-phosphate adenylyltransferase
MVVYPGTFDPMTLGHVDIVSRAQKLFGHVIVAIAKGLHKDALMPFNVRITLTEKIFGSNSHIQVKGFNGLLVDFLHQQDVRIIVRGIRNSADYHQEYQLANMNSMFDPSIETVFLPTDQRYSGISSSIVREIVKLKQDASKFIPTPVHQYFQSHDLT